MITLFRFSGLFLIVLVGIHWINYPIGFTVASSVATVLFAFCLIELYPGYSPNTGMWLGWFLIIIACLFLSVFESIHAAILLPVLLFVVGYRMAALPFDFSGDAQSNSSGGFDGGTGDGHGGGE